MSCVMRDFKNPYEREQACRALQRAKKWLTILDPLASEHEARLRERYRSEIVGILSRYPALNRDTIRKG